MFLFIVPIYTKGAHLVIPMGSYDVFGDCALFDESVLGGTDRLWMLGKSDLKGIDEERDERLALKSGERMLKEK